MMTIATTQHYFMKQAYKEALKAFKRGDVPVGAIAVKKGKVIARAHNQKEIAQNPTAHAELLVLQKASKKIKSWRLLDVTIYSTLEPCPMCAGAMLQARIKQLVYAAPDLRWGAVETFYQLFEDTRWNHVITVKKGVMKDEVEDLMKKFFKKIRSKKLNKT